MSAEDNPNGANVRGGADEVLTRITATKDQGGQHLTSRRRNRDPIIGERIVFRETASDKDGGLLEDEYLISLCTSSILRMEEVFETTFALASVRGPRVRGRALRCPEIRK